MNREPESFNLSPKEKKMTPDTESQAVRPGRRHLRGLKTGVGWGHVFRKPLVLLLILGLLCTAVVVYDFDNLPANAQEGAADGAHNCVFAPSESGSNNRSGFCDNSGGDVVNCSRTVTGAIPDALVFIECDGEIRQSDAGMGDNCQIHTELAADPERITCGLGLTDQVVECPSFAGALDRSDCHNVAEKADWVPPSDDEYSEQFCASTYGSREIYIQQGAAEVPAYYQTENSLCMDPTGILYKCHRSGLSLTGERTCKSTAFHSHHGLSETFCATQVAADSLSDVCTIGEGDAQRNFRCFNAEDVLNIDSLYNCTLTDADFVPLNETESWVVYDTGADADDLFTDDQCGTTYGSVGDGFDAAPTEVEEVLIDMTAMLAYHLDPDFVEGDRTLVDRKCLAWGLLAGSVIGGILTISIGQFQGNNTELHGLITTAGVLELIVFIGSSWDLWNNYREDEQRTLEISSLRTMIIGLTTWVVNAFQAAISRILRLEEVADDTDAELRLLQIDVDSAEAAATDNTQSVQELSDLVGSLQSQLENVEIRNGVREALYSLVGDIEAARSTGGALVGVSDAEQEFADQTNDLWDVEEGAANA